MKKSDFPQSLRLEQLLEPPPRSMQHLVELIRVERQVATDRVLLFLLQIKANQDLAITSRRQLFRMCLTRKPASSPTSDLLRWPPTERPDHVGVAASIRTLGDAAAMISQQVHRHLEDVAADFLGAAHLPGLPLLPGRAGGLIENVGRHLGIAGAALNEESRPVYCLAMRVSMAARSIPGLPWAASLLARPRARRDWTLAAPQPPCMRLSVCARPSAQCH